MATGSGAPIYESLIAERGDVPAEAREAAEQTRQTAAAALGWPGYGLGIQRVGDPSGHARR
jgi:hypothetical protein